MSQPTAHAPTPTATPSIQHFPVTLFASVMGVGGLALAWRRAGVAWDWPRWVGVALALFATAVFVVVSVAYAVKWRRHPAAARAELRHPVRMTFAPTLTISILILATALQDLAPALAVVLWWVGALGHLAVTLAVMSAWRVRSDIQAAQVTPAWFIPVVGNVITPLAAPALGSVEWAWLALGLGLVAWLGLLPIVLNRLLLVDPPMPARLLPTIAILVAPPAVGVVSWTTLVGGPLDPVRRILFGAALFFAVWAMAQPALWRLRFALPFWAFTFPAAALAAAAIAVDAAATGSAVGASTAYHWLAVTLLAGASVVVAMVAGLTVREVLRRRICLPE